MSFHSTSHALDRLAPPQAFVASWDDVLARAEVSAGAKVGRRRVRRRRLWLLAAAVLVAIMVPLATLAASQGWWFLASENPAVAPLSGVAVVKTGTWDGKDWELTAYRSSIGLCFAVTPGGSARSTGAGGGMSCADIKGVPRSQPSEETPLPITYLAAQATYLLPAHIAGPVIADAAHVRVYFGNGLTVTTPTFAAPASLDAIRFYAAQIPASVDFPTPGNLEDRFLKQIVGLDEHDRVVACLTLPPVRGYPLSACR
jgi:hypothetical protein